MDNHIISERDTGHRKEWRVKLYEVDETHKWIDKGTGIVTCLVRKGEEPPMIRVVSDCEPTKGSILLEQPISQDFTYDIEGKKIITLAQPSRDLQLALSFTDADGCRYIWTQMRGILGDRAVIYGNEKGKNVIGDIENNSTQSVENTKPEVEVEPLLPPTVENLSRIQHQIFTTDPQLKAIYFASLAKTDSEDDKTYLKKLVDLGKELVHTANTRGLHCLFTIVRSLLVYHEVPLMETLLSDKYFDDVLQILEYDPELHDKPDYRNCFQQGVRDTWVVAIRNKQTLELIRRLARVRFLKDIVLARSLDEKAFELITDLETTYGALIATALHNDESYLREIFSLVKSLDSDPVQRSEAIACLRELCTLAKKLLVPERNSFYRSIYTKAEENFYLICEKLLGDPRASISDRLYIGDVLKMMLQHEPADVRRYIMSENVIGSQKTDDGAPASISKDETCENGTLESKTLLAQLMARIVYDSEAGMQAQASEIVRMILDPETMEVQEKEDFLKLFYNRYVFWLVVPLQCVRAGVSGKRKRNSNEGSCVDSYQLVLNPCDNLLRSDETSRVAQHHVTELLSYCVQAHGYHIKYFAVKECVLSRVLRLVYSRDKHLVLDAIRFARTCVGLRDTCYNRHIVDFDLFSSIFDVFSINGNRNNLINSAIIELLEFIHADNVEVLIDYLCESYSQELSKITYVDTFQKLKSAYERNRKSREQEAQKEKFRPAPIATSGGVVEIESKSENIHVESKNNAIVSRKGLVDYDDEDDDAGRNEEPDLESSSATAIPS